jgi:regulator of replication initiation timing
MTCIIENLNIDIDKDMNDQIYVSLQWYQDAIKVQEMLKEQKDNAKTIFDNLEIIDHSINNISNSFNEIKDYNNKLLKLNKILISEHPFLLEDKVIIHNKCEKMTNTEIEINTKKQKLYKIELFRICKCICYW